MYTGGNLCLQTSLRSAADHGAAVYIRRITLSSTKSRRLSQYVPSLSSSVSRCSPEGEQEEYRVYGWLNHSRGHSPASYGTSLGVSRVAAPVRLEARQRRLQQQPLSDEGPGHFFNGSRAKYERLLTEWQEGEQASVCPGSPPWRERYQVIHNEVTLSVPDPGWVADLTTGHDGATAAEAGSIQLRKALSGVRWPCR